MKTLKTTILTTIAVIVIFCGFISTSYSSTAQTETTISISHKPGPNYVWIAGHYKHNKYGKLVWVPGHWKKI